MPRICGWGRIFDCIDLTYGIGETGSRYLTDPAPKIRVNVAEISPEGKVKSGYTELVIRSHHGTHIDAPAHKIPGGKTIDAYDLGKFINPALLVDLTQRFTEPGSGYVRKISEGILRQVFTSEMLQRIGEGRISAFVFRTGYDKTIERGVTDDFAFPHFEKEAAEDELHRQLLKEFEKQRRQDIIPTARIPEMIRIWDRRLANSLRRQVPPMRVLCTGLAMEDTTLLLDRGELKEFIKWAAGQWGTSSQKLVDAAAVCRKSLKACSNLEETLGAIMDAFENPTSSSRPVLNSPDLRRLLSAYVDGRPRDKVRRRPGGAPVNMAYILRQLGLNVGVHWHYHRPQLAEHCPRCAVRVCFDKDRKHEHSINTGDIWPDTVHPFRGSLIFAFPEGLVFDPFPASGQIRSRGSGRIPFGFPYYVGERSWRNIEVKGFGRSERLDPGSLVDNKGLPVLEKDGWPTFPPFGSWRVEGETLLFEIADETLMKELARQYDIAILGGLHAFREELFRHPQTRGLAEFMRDSLRRQLEILASEGVTLHAEMGDMRYGEVMKTIAEVMRGVVPSLSLNEDDLAKITAFEGTQFFFAPRPATSREPIYTRYQRAVHLARALDLYELWLHANDADILLVKVTKDLLAKGILQRAIGSKMAANLFAKGVVVLALLQRSLPGWRSEVEKFPPVLAGKGFKALIDLAWDYSRNLSLTTSDQQLAIFQQIVLHGYHYSRDSDDYALIVVPVMWPTDLPPAVDTTGLGDMYCAMVGVF